MVLCAALAACSDGNTNRTVTAPDVRPVFSEAPADVGVGLTVDGPFDLAFAPEAGSAQLAAAAQAATGGRASGHVSLLPFGPIASEHYSFVALSTDPSTPFAAKGQYELMLTTVTGRTNKIHGDVICMGITGNTARIAGQITTVWVNNVQVPITAATHNVWVVVDNGEGPGTPDFVSPMSFANAATAQLHCAAGTPTTVFFEQQGNIQVQP
jgi:hypothetical protein